MWNEVSLEFIYLLQVTSVARSVCRCNVCIPGTYSVIPRTAEVRVTLVTRVNSRD